MRWTSHPMKRRPRDAMLALFVITLTAWAVLANGEAWLAVLAVIILLAAIAPFVIPTHYAIDDTGISARRLFTTKRRAWSQLRRVDAGETFALVSPFAERRFLDRYRGVTVLYDGGDRDQILRELRAHLG